MCREFKSVSVLAEFLNCANYESLIELTYVLLVFGADFYQ